MSWQSNTDGLKSLEPPDATVPDIRVRSAQSLQDMLRRMMDMDTQGGRSWKRAKVQGLVDGNPPFSPSRLKQRGRADACNVNWGTARSYLGEAEGILFDLTTESPCQIMIRTSHGTDEQRVLWSQVMSEEAHEVISGDPRWGYIRQCSQKQTTLMGCGPIWFENPSSVMPRWCLASQLQVPDNAESETSYWEIAFILVEYKCHELYEMIEDAAAAERVGWNTEYTKRVIMNAIPKPQQTGWSMTWEWVQQQAKQNSFASYWGSDVIMLAHAFWKEFDGLITHAIIEQAPQGPSTGYTGSGATGEESDEDGPARYLFIHPRRYQAWTEILHPMYYDKGNGTHYSVNGIGVPMYGALMVDKALSPKLVFRQTLEGNKPLNYKTLGNYAVVSSGFELEQFGVNGALQDGMSALQEIQLVTARNLAAYRTGISREDGNPVSGAEARIKAQQQFAVQNTTIARYYEQLDQLYSEIVRRLCQLGSRDPLAEKFQQRCKAKGVPEEAIGRLEKVWAARAVGAGSAALRQQGLDHLMTAINRLPEEGQDNLIEQWIASWAGQRSVDLFYPKRKAKMMGTEQQAEAMLQVSAMKVGVHPIITPQQDAVVFAGVFLGAAGQAAGALGNGGDNAATIRFIDMAAAAAIAHIRRFASDPSRKPILREMTAMVKKLEVVANRAKSAMARQAAQQPGQAQAPAKIDPAAAAKLEIERQRGQIKIRNMVESHRQRMLDRAEQHAVEMRIKEQNLRSLEPR